METSVRIDDIYKSGYSLKVLKNSVNDLSRELNIRARIKFGSSVVHQHHYDGSLFECFLLFNTKVEAAEFMLHYN